MSTNQSKVQQIEMDNLRQTVLLLRSERDKLQIENFELREKLDEMKSFFGRALDSAPSLWVCLMIYSVEKVIAP